MARDLDRWRCQPRQEDNELLEEWKAMGTTGNAKPGAVYSNEEERYDQCDYRCLHTYVHAVRFYTKYYIYLETYCFAVICDPWLHSGFY